VQKGHLFLRAGSNLTKAPHILRDSVPVVLRFSNFAGVPTVADNDPNAAGRAALPSD